MIDIDDLVDEMSFKADKWMPDDPEYIEDFFNSDEESQKEMINDNMDEYFSSYLDVEEDGQWISDHRKEILQKLWEKMS